MNEEEELEKGFGKLELENKNDIGSSQHAPQSFSYVPIGIAGPPHFAATNAAPQNEAGRPFLNPCVFPYTGHPPVGYAHAPTYFSPPFPNPYDVGRFHQPYPFFYGNPYMPPQPSPQNFGYNPFLGNSGAPPPPSSSFLLPTPTVLLYIDNSNIFLEAQKYSGKLKRFIKNLPDITCRIDIGKLVTRAVGDRQCLVGILYGSEPPALDTVWGAIRRLNIEVKTYSRSKITRKEKEVDTSLVADAVANMYKFFHQAGPDRSVIVFSGDRDIICIVDKAVENGYKVEIWAFGDSINKAVEKLAEEQPKNVHIFKIDEIFGIVTFTKWIWTKPVPRERSIVARFSGSFNLTQSSFREFTAKATEIFRLPMTYKIIDDSCIALVPFYKETNQSRGAGGQNEQQQDKLYDFYKDIQPKMHLLKNAIPGMCMEVKSYHEYVHEVHQERNTSTPLSNTFQCLTDDEGNDTEVEGDVAEDESYEYPEDFHEDFADFTTVTRKEKPNPRQYSSNCVFKFWCTKGTSCTYTHTPEEHEFFKIEKRCGFRRIYKTKPCYKSYSDCCTYRNNTYLCRFAHNLEESRCLCCNVHGKHWMNECPSKGDN